MLTPKQRIEAYTYAMLLILADPDKDGRYPICGSLQQWYVESINDHRSVINQFPEFIKHRPCGKYYSDAWWSFTQEGNLTRLTVLSSCIEEVERVMKNK